LKHSLQVTDATFIQR